MYFDVHESDNLQDCMEMKRFEGSEKNETGKRYRCESGGNDC